MDAFRKNGGKVADARCSGESWSAVVEVSGMAATASKETRSMTVTCLRASWLPVPAQRLMSAVLMDRQDVFLTLLRKPETAQAKETTNRLERVDSVRKARLQS